MAKQFLNETSPEAFVDFPPLKFVVWRGGVRTEEDQPPKGTCVCAKCKGYGGWNLEINAYPKKPEDEACIRSHLKTTPFVNLPGHDMTEAQFRHHYVHFKASCDNCNGWGYVNAKQGDHVHTWDKGVKVGNCLTLYTCTGCGDKWEVDSSG